MPTSAPGNNKVVRLFSGRSRLPALIAAFVFFLVFAGLALIPEVFRVTFHPPFTFIPAGEERLWLAFFFLLVPGGLFLGFGLSDAAAPGLRRAWARLQSLNRGKRAASIALLFLLTFFSARLSHRLILDDRPITDDEYATQFGGQVLASGRITAPQPQPPQAYSMLFLFEKNGAVTSVDWPVPVAAWAVSERTRTGPLIFALFAGAAAAAVAAIGAILFSPAYGLAAFLLFVFSPMAFLLSATTHAHLLSRGAIALTILAFILAERKSSTGRWIAAGFLAAVSFSCRPVEATALLFPLAADFTIRALRGKGLTRRDLFFSILGAIFPLVMFFLYNGLVTGNFAVPPRFYMEGPGDTIAGESLANRLVFNSGYNFLMLCIWFLGPLGVAAVAVGAGRIRLTKLLSLGVLLNILAGLLHDNHGLHIVGPIHYSECAVPLTIIALAGLIAMKNKLARIGLPGPAFAAAISGALVFGLGPFAAWQSGALKAQARIQNDVYGGIESSLEAAGVARAVVLSPRFADIWRANPEYRARGAWVFEWRRARPDLSDKYLIVHDVPGAEVAFRKKFPDRPIFRISLMPRSPYWKISPAESRSPYEAGKAIR